MVRSLFKINERNEFVTPIFRVAIGKMQFIKKTIAIYFSELFNSFVACQYSAIGIGFAPIELHLFFQIAMLAIAEIGYVAIRFLLFSRSCHSLFNHIPQTVRKHIARI